MPRHKQKLVSTNRQTLSTAVARAAALSTDTSLELRLASNLQEGSFDVKEDIEYDFVSERGKGELATVYRSRERQTGKILAVKVYHEVKKPLEAIQRRLESGYEGQVLEIVRGRHDHIMAGGTLRKLLHEGKDQFQIPMQYYHYDLSRLMDDTKEYRGLIEDFISIPPWYGEVVTQMLDALEFLHRKEIMILHRNIDPHNILFNRINHFTLAGFGLATFGHPPKGEHGGPARSYIYMPPEVYRPDEEETTAVDLWALGILCLDMLALLPSIKESHCNYDTMKDLPLSDYLCELAKNLDKPEVEMMVVRRVAERFPAGLVLRSVNTTGKESIKKTHFQASLELVYLLFRVQSRFSGWQREDVRECAKVYLKTVGQDQQPPPASRPTGGRASEVTSQEAQAGSGRGTTSSSNASLERVGTTGSASSQPPPPPRRPPAVLGGRPESSSPTAANIMDQLADLSRGRAVLLVTGIERLMPGSIQELSEELFPKSLERIAPPGGGGRPLPETTLDFVRPGGDRPGPSGSQSGQSPRGQDARKQTDEVKAKEKQPSPPTSSRLQGQSQRAEACSEKSPPRRQELQSQQDKPRTKGPSPPPASCPEGPASQESGQSRAGPSRAEAQAQLEQTQAKQPPRATLAQARGSIQPVEAVCQSSGTPNAQGRLPPQSAATSRSRDEAPKQQAEPATRPPARGQAAEGQKQQQPAQAAQGQQREGKSEEKQVPKSTGQGSKMGSSGKGKKRR